MAKSLLTLASLLAAVLCIRAQCNPSRYLQGTPQNCNPENDSECCEAGEQYPQYTCSPPVTGQTGARMTMNNFQQGGDGGGPSECDGQYHDDTEMVVALSTGWYSGGSRCLKPINIYYNGNTAEAQVVDECDSINGCDYQHGFRPPCRNNVVDASRAVWEALGVPESETGDLEVTWSDANWEKGDFCLHAPCSI